MSVEIDELSPYPYAESPPATLHTTVGSASIVVARRTGDSGTFQFGNTGANDQNHKLVIVGVDEDGSPTGTWDGTVLELDPSNDRRAKVRCVARALLVPLRRRGSLFARLIRPLLWIFRRRAPSEQGTITVTVRLCRVGSGQCVDDGDLSSTLAVLFET